jgi:uncharacterized protein (TIGR00297 family)
MRLLASPTNAEWAIFVLIFVGLGSFIGIAEFIRKKLNWSPEVTRKLVHISTGILIFFAPRLFSSGIPAILLGLVFALVNFAAVRFGLLKGIHGTNRRSYGTVYYPLSFLILVLLFWDSFPQIISISILVLAFSDAAAAIVGENLAAPHLYYLTSDKKSIEGSATMFATTLFVVLFLLNSSLALTLGPGLNLDFRFTLLLALAVSLFVTGWEAISSKGFDNLTIPLSTAFVLHYFLVQLPHHNHEQFLLGMALAAFMAIASYYVGFLSASGSVGTFLLATIIFGVGGWQWTIPILTFFILSSLLSKLGKRNKAKFQLMFEKTDTRDAGQVAANGGVAGIVMLCWYIFPENNLWYLVYLASLAAVTADTWGTEIGLLAKGSPRLITSLRKVETGTSGGVSLSGFAGGALGASLLALSGSFWFRGSAPTFTFIIIICSGILGALVDSLLGATVQAQYRCTVCGKITERTLHCGTSSMLVRGVRWIDNDVVNWACALAGGISLFLMTAGISVMP